MKPSEIAKVLLGHELHTVQAVNPFRTEWRCPRCGYTADASKVRHAEAQAKHQAERLSVLLRKEQRAST